MRLSYAVIAASIISAATVSSASAQSIAGDWNASYNSPGGPIAFKLAFIVDGEKLTGTVKRSSGDVPLTGTVKGDSVRFSYTIKYGDNDLLLSIVAKVTGGTAMKGSVDFAGQAQESFEAKKASATGSLDYVQHRPR
ncbi:MAG: hypothetical protein ABJB74_19210 [Gemmatimonas sp.]